MFEYTQAQVDAQAAALAPYIRIWLNWMMVVVVLMPLIFIRRKQGRIALLCSVLMIALAIPAGWIFGLSNFLSLIHLILWTPLVIYFCKQMRDGHIPVKSFFGIWSQTMVATCIISLVFDIRDFARWLMGDRGIVSYPEQMQIAWISSLFIAILLGTAAAYVYKKFPNNITENKATE